MFVPDASDVEGGTFWVGSQEDGCVYRFRLPLISGGTAAVYLGKLKTWSDGGIQGLEFDWFYPSPGRAFVLIGSRIPAVAPDGTLLHEYTGIPSTGGGGPEGAAWDGSSLYIAEDPGAQHEVWKFAGCSL